MAARDAERHADVRRPEPVLQLRLLGARPRIRGPVGQPGRAARVLRAAATPLVHARAPCGLVIITRGDTAMPVNRLVWRASVAMSLTALAACNFFDVENPGPIADEDLNNPSAMTGLVTGMSFDLSQAIDATAQ